MRILTTPSRCSTPAKRQRKKSAAQFHRENDFGVQTHAAMPQHNAERLCLSGNGMNDLPRLRLGRRAEAEPQKPFPILTGKPEAYRNVRRHSRDSAILASLHSSARKLCVPVIRCGFLLSLVLAGHANLQAQQPFTVDDADVTEHKKFQLQISHEFDVLPRSAHPSLRQNTTVFVLNYGLLRDVEIGVDYPLIVISNAAGTAPPIRSFGDLNFHVKYNFLQEREGKRRP